ncbi:MAG: hypothetical protein ACLRWQ_18665 [Flavonifractor plautii]
MDAVIVLLILLFVLLALIGVPVGFAIGGTTDLHVFNAQYCYSGIFLAFTIIPISCWPAPSRNPLAASPGGSWTLPLRPDRFCDRRPGVRVFHAGLHVLRRPYRLRHGLYLPSAA